MRWLERFFDIMESPIYQVYLSWNINENLRKLDTSFDFIQFDGIRELGEIGEKISTSNNSEIRCEVQRIVSGLNNTRNDINWRVRFHAVEALGRINDEKAIEAIVDALDDGEERVVKKAAETIIENRGDKTARALTNALTHEQMRIRKFAASEFLAIGLDNLTVEDKVLCLLFYRKNDKIDKILAIGENVIGELVKRMNDEHRDVRIAVILVLQKITEKIGIPKTQQLLVKYTAEESEKGRTVGMRARRNVQDVLMSLVSKSRKDRGQIRGVLSNRPIKPPTGRKLMRMQRRIRNG